MHSVRLVLEIKVERFRESTGLHGVTFLKLLFSIATAVRSSNPIIRCKVSFQKGREFLETLTNVPRLWPLLDSSIVLVLQNYGHKGMQNGSHYLYLSHAWHLQWVQERLGRMGQWALLTATWDCSSKVSVPLLPLRLINLNMSTVPLSSLQDLQLRSQCSRRDSGCLRIRGVWRQY